MEQIKDEKIVENVKSKDNNVELTTESKENVKEETKTTNETSTETPSDQIYVPNSTLHSMVIFGLPKYLDSKKFTKFLEQNNVPFKKIKKIVKESFGIVSFDSVEDRDKYLEYFQGFQFNDKTKLKTEAKEEKSDRMKRKYEEKELDKKEDNRESKLLTIEEIVCPWYNIPYEEQLKKKKNQIEKVMINIKSTTRKESLHNLPEWLVKRDKTKEEKMCCGLEEIVPSPVTENYRNKAQYTIGYDADNKPCVGFALGRTGNGITIVADPSNAPLISKRSNEIRRLFNEYITEPNLGSNRKPFDKNSHSGFWRQLTVRDFTTGETMATVQFNHKGLTAEELETEKNNLKNYFASLPEEQRITSLSIQLYDGISNSAPVDLAVETIDGPEFIHENLLGCQFRVSANAFFQINTKATELLYSKVLDWAQVSQDTTLLDICCGTGTIGQCISKKVKKVIGLEISPDAVIDSINNAKLNKIDNAEYLVGKAEDTLPTLLTKSNGGKDQEFIGIVDPPRGGLHGDVLKAIRTFEPIKKLVYVSCNQNSLIPDAAKLCKGISKTMKGTPFVPTKAIAFDLFPHTDLVELVVLFERVENNTTTTTTTTTNSDNNLIIQENENEKEEEEEEDKKRKRDENEEIENENNEKKEIKLEN
ncbi:hypothetical protein DDB_G0293244 [Dictyostelium discoideum AX4]|uniref:Uncharacterized protein n=1 Tax=Dictyostelium discoideum TaxID=44689 RepID=Q54C42_DICDI|nr:hypothetical protein DDB_G0293244 [Dictyostelium discoideum AX4]EAL60821.1 hypothetical protein DDB_G0293244 [Dictyostelium discoideum AX4]|eukprot:XP_629224.1 hypothetical protein DDB_G0293244 [Dictyostelium discoideum AX4]